MSAVYTTLYINPANYRNNRIVLMEPTTETPSTGKIVLQTEKYKDFAGVVLQGDESNTQLFVQTLDGQDFMFNALEDEELLERVITLGRSLGLVPTFKQPMFSDAVERIQDESLVVKQPALTPREPYPPLLDYGTEQNTQDKTKHSDDPTLLMQSLDQGANYFERLGFIETAAALDRISDRLLHPVKRPYEKPTVTRMTARQVEAATKNPTAKQRPLYISTKGIAVWEKVVSEFQSTIRKFDKFYDRWVAAIILYRRCCNALGVVAFNTGRTKQEVADIRKRVRDGNFKADRMITEISNDLIGENIITSITDEKFDNVNVYNNRYYLRTIRRIHLKSGIKPTDVVSRLRLIHGFDGSGGKWAKKSVDGITDIVIEPAPRRQVTMCVFVTSWLTREQAETLTEQPREITDNKLLTTLRKAGRRWFETGHLVAR